MDKNYKQKVKDFFKKEGFYVVLFLCLCIVTTVAAVSLKKANKPEAQPQVNETENEITLNVDDKNVTNQMPNAERVEKEDTTKNAVTPVNTNSEVKFANPVDGSLRRQYTYPKPVEIVKGESFRTIKGIDIEAKIGTSVKAGAEGIVEEVKSEGPEEGMTVIIKHANGLKTKYCNLNKDVSVKKDQKVTADTVIGTVGETANVFNKEEFGEHLNLQVINAKGEQVDPLKYFTYEN